MAVSGPPFLRKKGELREARCPGAVLPPTLPTATPGEGKVPQVGRGGMTARPWIRGAHEGVWGRGRGTHVGAACDPPQGVGGRAGVAGGGLQCRWGLRALREEVQGHRGGRSRTLGPAPGVFRDPRPRGSS